MKLTDLTLPDYQCTFSASCPAVLQQGDKLIIIGKFMSFRDRYQAGIEGCVGDDEAAVIIDAKIVIEALKAYLAQEPACPSIPSTSTADACCRSSGTE